MDILFGCIVFGVVFVFLAQAAAGTYLDEKERREDKRLQLGPPTPDL